MTLLGSDLTSAASHRPHYSFSVSRSAASVTIFTHRLSGRLIPPSLLLTPPRLSGSAREAPLPPRVPTAPRAPPPPSDFSPLHRKGLAPSPTRSSRRVFTVPEAAGHLQDTGQGQAPEWLDKSKQGLVTKSLHNYEVLSEHSHATKDNSDNRVRGTISPPTSVSPVLKMPKATRGHPLLAIGWQGDNTFPHPSQTRRPAMCDPGTLPDLPPTPAFLPYPLYPRTDTQALPGREAPSSCSALRRGL